ncbi:MAG: nuclease A inhibitor family protein [Acidobacteriota bacterium]|nr:nuclease A inhibitor family protein [Acidobacteriota bacterium]
MKSDKQVLAELKNASTGLLVMSESDYPFELIQWSGETAITSEYLCSVSDRPEATRIEETDTKRFLGENERFRKLQAVIESNLADVKVYKVGAINIPVYIVGRSPEGSWLGLSTRLIQT